MSEISQQENAIILAAAERMVALGSEAAQRIINGKSAVDQDTQGEEILRLLTVYRNKASLDEKQLESILYELRERSDETDFPATPSILGGTLSYIITQPVIAGSLRIQNSGSDLPFRDYLSFNSPLLATDDGTRINVTLPTERLNLTDLLDVTISSPTSGQALTWNGSLWVNGIGGHTILNPSGASLASRGFIKFYNGLTGSDNTPNTDVKLGGEIVSADTKIVGTGNDLSFMIGTADDSLTNDTAYFQITKDTASDSNYIGLVHMDTLVSDVVSFSLGRVNGVTQMQFDDARATPQGLQYADPGYETTGTDLTLTSRGYVLSVTGTKWSLVSGGTLTGNNVIEFGAYSLKFKTGSVDKFAFSGTTLTMGDGSTPPIIDMTGGLNDLHKILFTSSGTSFQAISGHANNGTLDIITNGSIRFGKSAANDGVLTTEFGQFDTNPYCI
jgi:hypothetical protein